MNLHVLDSGSCGNSYCIETQTDLIFVDIGVTLGKVRECLQNCDTDGKKVSLFITHEHTDHIGGLAPFVRNYSPQVYASRGTLAMLNGKAPDDNFHELTSGEYYDMDSFAAVPFEISHDAAEPFGFVLMTADGNVGVATDLGCVTDKQLKHMELSDLLILETNHDEEMLKRGSYPAYLKRRIASHRGHLSNSTAMSAISALNSGHLKRCFFAHVSEENNSYDFLEQLSRFCRSAYDLQADVLRQKQYYCFEYSLEGAITPRF